MNSRDEATAFLRRMEAEHPTDHMNRANWPADERAAYEAWEARELAKKAGEAAYVYADGGPMSSGTPPTPLVDPALVDWDKATVTPIASDPLPVTAAKPAAPGRKRGGR